MSRRGDDEGRTDGTTTLVQHVETDPDLSPAEQQTSIVWTGEDDEATICTEERGMVLSILRSPVATVETLRVSDEERIGAVVPPDEYESGMVTGVEATVPIGAVKIKSSARSSDRRSLVVSDHNPTDGGDSG